MDMGHNQVAGAPKMGDLSPRRGGQIDRHKATPRWPASPTKKLAKDMLITTTEFAHLYIGLSSALYLRGCSFVIGTPILVGHELLTEHLWRWEPSVLRIGFLSHFRTNNTFPQLAYDPFASFFFCLVSDSGGGSGGGCGQIGGNKTGGLEKISAIVPKKPPPPPLPLDPLFQTSF